ncbi:MAG: hypothetical protein SVU32_05645 [Candidatus Nanohaloarchaea archaeon]|nr:hypothetical protein [Candidatus Nanohaloarchaea archaeon]
MERKDYLVIGGALLVSALVGFAARGIQSVQTIAMVTLGLTVAAFITTLIALVAIYKARKPYGGKVARNLEVIGFGLALFIVTYLPHVVWHIFGLQNNNPLGPAWLGLSKAWWAGFYHIGAFMFFLIASYGFYLFWKH